MSELRKQVEDRLFRMYVTDGVKAIADNTSVLYSKGTSLKSRYIELIDTNHSGPEEEPEETAEQIINRITSGINKLGKGG